MTERLSLSCHVNLNKSVCFSLVNLFHYRDPDSILAKNYPSPSLIKQHWIRKLWYIYTMEYYSAIRKNLFESVLMKWMKWEPVTQSEVSQKDKRPIQYTNTYIWNLERW